MQLKQMSKGKLMSFRIYPLPSQSLYLTVLRFKTLNYSDYKNVKSFAVFICQVLDFSCIRQFLKFNIIIVSSNQTNIYHNKPFSKSHEFFQFTPHPLQKRVFFVFVFVIDGQMVYFEYCIYQYKCKMSQQSFKKMLAKLKQEYASKSIALKIKELSVQDIAQLLYKYIKIEPFVLREMLLKSTGKFNISWDDLLSYLEEDIAIEQQVKKIQISPLSATEIHERHENQFSSLMTYIRSKETNQIQYIQRISQSLGQNLYAVCLQKELIFYDDSLSKVINSLFFKYSGIKEASNKREEIKKESNDMKESNEIETNDKVQEMEALEPLKMNHSKLQKSHNRVVTTTLKGSVRGSEMSSQKSKSFETMQFNRLHQTDVGSILKKQSKSNINTIKIKNDEIGKVFQFFSEASINNSIKIAQAYTLARSQFHKNIILDQSILEKDKTSVDLALSSAHLHKNFNSELQNLRKGTKAIEIARIAKSVDVNNLGIRYRRGSYKVNNVGESDFNIRAVKKKANMQKTVLHNKVLSIVAFHVFENYLIISLFNREIRLFHLRTNVNRISEQLIFQKRFQSIISYVRIYKSKNHRDYRIAIIAQKQNKAELTVYHLDSEMNPLVKAYSLEVPFSAKCTFCLPFGVALYNELGHFYFVQLNNFLDQNEQKHILSTRLYDGQNHIQISICQVLLNKDMINFYMSCTHGSIYNFDRYSKSIKTSLKICNTQILDMILMRQDKQLIVLYGHGNITILSTLNLSKIYTYLSYTDFLSEPKLLLTNQHHLFIYASRHIHPYILNQNQERNFNNIKPMKILRSRLKIKQKDKLLYNNSKQQVLKVFAGCGGEGDFVALVLERGEIMLLSSLLEYIGSYHYLKVSSILQIVCNKNTQFLALLLDNNNIQIVNIYTQKLLFSIKSLQNERQALDRSQSNGLGVKQKRKGKNIHGQTIKLMSFMSLKQAQTFFAYITSNNYIYHYSQKGSLLEVVNLQERSCGDTTNLSHMLYVDEQLVIAKNENLINLHRKSYNRKYTMKVSQKPLIDIKRSNNSSICAIDTDYSIYLINIHQQDIKCLRKHTYNHSEENDSAESILFNEKMVIKCYSSQVLLRFMELQVRIRIEQQSQCVSLLHDNILKINKNTSKIYRYNIPNRQFQEIFI